MKTEISCLPKETAKSTRLDRDLISIKREMHLLGLGAAATGDGKRRGTEINVGSAHPSPISKRKDGWS